MPIVRARVVGRTWGKTVMHRIVLALLTLLAAAPAHASDADTLRKFGMLGRLAIDCTQPHSQQNPHLIYAASPQASSRAP